MATRRERWLKYRARCQRQKSKQRNRGFRYESPGHGTGPGGKRLVIGRSWEYEDRGFMPPCFVSDALKLHGPPHPIFSLFFNLNVRPAEYQKPPVPFVTGAALGYHPFPHHFEFAVHGYHRRRVQAWGSRTTKGMNGITRRLWWEGIFYMQNGYFRDIDPAGRRPNATDIDNGAPIDSPSPWPGIPLLPGVV